MDELKIGSKFWWCDNLKDPEKLTVCEGWRNGSILDGRGADANPRDCIATELEAWRETYRRRQEAANAAYLKISDMVGAYVP